MGPSHPERDLASKQFVRGYADAQAGHSPSLLRGPYMQGYSRGKSEPRGTLPPKVVNMDQHDTHVIAQRSHRAVAQCEAQIKIAKILEGYNSDQCRRILNAAAAMNDLDIRIPVPRFDD